MSPADLALGATLNLALAGAALARRSLTPAGAIAGVVVGFGLFVCGGLATWLLLALFFVSSTVLSCVGHRSKEAAESLTGKGGRRDVVQVLANGGPALLSGLLWLLTAEPGFSVGMIAALAAANADTWASEIGLLSRNEPVSLVGLRPVERGRSGGVTLLGLGASLAGSCLIGGAYGLCCLIGGECALPPLSSTLVVAACGFSGSLVDSLLGATVQGRFRVAESGAYTERGRGKAGVRNTLVGGLRLVTNDTVNFVSGLLVAGAAVLLAGTPVIYRGR